MDFIKKYQKSFTFSKSFRRNFIVDVLTVVVITLLFLGFGAFLEQKANEISDGKSIEQLKVDLLAGDVESNQLFVDNIRSFTYYFVGGGIILLLLTFILFSYSRQLIWKNSLKINWKWNGIILILLILFILYLLFYALVRLIVNSYLTFGNQTSADIFSQSLNAFFFLIFITFTFLTYYNFVHKNKVWETIGSTFSLIKVKWAILWKSFLLIVLTGIIISIITYYIQKQLIFQPAWVTSSLSIGILLLFLSWTRLYLVDTIK